VKVRSECRIALTGWSTESGKGHQPPGDVLYICQTYVFLRPLRRALYARLVRHVKQHHQCSRAVAQACKQRCGHCHPTGGGSPESNTGMMVPSVTNNIQHTSSVDGRTLANTLRAHVRVRKRLMQRSKYSVRWPSGLRPPLYLGTSCHLRV